jgi:hypothetical protein
VLVWQSACINYACVSSGSSADRGLVSGLAVGMQRCACAQKDERRTHLCSDIIHMKKQACVSRNEISVMRYLFLSISFSFT